MNRELRNRGRLRLAGRRGRCGAGAQRRTREKAAERAAVTSAEPHSVVVPCPSRGRSLGRLSSVREPRPRLRRVRGALTWPARWRIGCLEERTRTHIVSSGARNTSGDLGRLRRSLALVGRQRDAVHFTWPPTRTARRRACERRGTSGVLRASRRQRLPRGFHPGRACARPGGRRQRLRHA